MEGLGSIRKKAAPKKTGIGYKVFFRKDGKLYPPMVANPDGKDTPIGVWLDADAAPIVSKTKTGRPQVKNGGKGTQGGSGKLAFRPGWHLGMIPYALQFNRMDENGEKTLFPKDFVWAEVEYAMDRNYQKEAESYGYNKNGKYLHSFAGLPYLPEDGYYIYRTNPNPETDPWIITGAMKVNKILSNKEVDKLVISAGREPQRRESLGRIVNHNSPFLLKSERGEFFDSKFHLNGEFYTPVNQLIIDSNEHFFKLQVKELFEDRKFEDFKVVDGTFDVRLLDENGKTTGLRYRYLYYPETVNEEMIKVCDYFETLGKFAPQYVAAFSDRPMFKNFNDADAFLKSYKNGIQFIEKILQNGNQCLSEIHNDFPSIFFVSDDKKKMIEYEAIIKTELSKIKSKFLIQKIIVALKELLSKIEVKYKNIINERLGYVENRLSEIEKYGGWISTKRKIFESLNVKKAPSTFKYEDYISNETINRPSLCGIFHDRGYKIASNAQILVALKEDYDPKLEGKIIWTEKVKEDIENSGFDLSNAKYPQWESVIPPSDAMKSIDIDWNEVLTKANRTENLAKVYGDKHSCFVMVCGEKNYCIDPTLLKKFAKAAIKIGASNLYYNDKKFGGVLLVENEKGKLLMMTMAPRNIVDSDYMYPYGIYIANNNTSDSKLRLAKARAKAIIIRQRQRARKGMKGLFGEY